MSETTQLQEAVRQRYAAAAQLSLAGESGSCCGPTCCSDNTAADPITRDLYDDTESVPQAALSASLGCGNPTALIDLSPGQDVLDLGSGGGLDVLLSARRVAPDGTAHGLDMTDEMLELAERNRAEAGIDNARFIKGTIEDIPLPDAAVDVVISNCVINLSTDKDQALTEAHRVLRPGGRFAVSDIVLLRPLEQQWATVVELWTGCISGALTIEEYQSKLTAAGFDNPTVEVTRSYTDPDLAELADDLTGPLPDGINLTEAITNLSGTFASAFIRADKAKM